MELIFEERIELMKKAYENKIEQLLEQKDSLTKKIGSLERISEVQEE